MTDQEHVPVIGIAGLGRMGQAIAARFISTEHEVYAWTRSGIPDAIAKKDGVTVCTNIPDLIARCNVVLISVLDDVAVENVLSQVCECDLTGTLLVETSTVSPDALVKHLDRIIANGGHAIDAPISGGPDMIAQGKAGLYIGGGAEDVTRFMPLASVLSNRVVHVGSVGTGHAAKIVNNMMLAGFWQTLKEAVQVGSSAGLSLDTMITLLTASPAANAALKHRAPVILGNSNDVGFSVSGAIKDVSLFVETARRANVDAPTMSAALKSFRACGDAGHAAEDLAVMIREIGEAKGENST